MIRLLYLLFLAGCTFLVSIRGGTIPYLLFYFALFLPATALFYTFYVYVRFRIVQEVSRVVVKAAEVPYRLILANEDPIPFLNIRLHYFEDMVTLVYGEEAEALICLLPHQKKQVDIKMYCKYRGTYSVGVKSVSVTDFLGLFTITYPMNSQIRLTAKPRLLSMDQLLLSLSIQDQKAEAFPLMRSQELAGLELRSYQAGDPLKYVHWKNSAKTGNLLVRKTIPEELVETIVFPDLSPQTEFSDNFLQIQDNIIEATLALLHDYDTKNIPVRVVGMTSRLFDYTIDSPAAFDRFYELCAELPFEAPLTPEAILSDFLRHALTPPVMILVTARASDTLLAYIQDKKRLGCEIHLIETGEPPL